MAEVTGKSRDIMHKTASFPRHYIRLTFETKNDGTCVVKVYPSIKYLISLYLHVTTFFTQQMILLFVVTKLSIRNVRDWRQVSRKMMTFS